MIKSDLKKFIVENMAKNNLWVIVYAMRKIGHDNDDVKLIERYVIQEMNLADREISKDSVDDAVKRLLNYVDNLL